MVKSCGWAHQKVSIYFLFISNHMSPCQRKNSKIPKIKTTQMNNNIIVLEQSNNNNINLFVTDLRSPNIVNESYTTSCTIVGTRTRKKGPVSTNLSRCLRNFSLQRLITLNWNDFQIIPIIIWSV